MRNAKRAYLGPKTKQAFTLLEVTIAIGILAFGLLGIAAMSLHAMKQGRSGKQATEAQTIGYTILEEFNRMNFADPNLAATPWTPLQALGNITAPIFPATTFPQAAQFSQGTVLNQGVVTTSQVYQVRWQITDAPAPPAPPWPPGTLPVRKFIEVQVQWFEPDSPVARQVTISGVRYDDEPTDI